MQNSTEAHLAERTIERTCVGCRQTDSTRVLVRLVIGPEGEVVPDLGGGSFGRGVWVHPRPECLSQAVPRGLAHGLKHEVKADARGVAALLRAAARRRFFALLSSAFRARKAAVGTTAVKEAFERGAVKLYVVAADAKAAAAAPWVERAVSEGSALVFGMKQELGPALAGDEVGVVGILDEGLAHALRDAHALSTLSEPRPAREDRELTTEVR